MNIKKKFVCVFMLTFLLGCVSVILLKFQQTEKRNVSVVETESVSPPEIESQTHAPVQTAKNEIKPKLFKVADFWDESLGLENKHFIETGGFTAEENIQVKSGENWLGLFGANDKTYLRRTKIRVKRSKEYDDFSGEISVNAKEKPLFLVKNLKKVKEGETKTLFRGLTWEDVKDTGREQTSLRKGFSQNYKLGENKFTLRVEEGVDENQHPILVLLLETESKSQIVYYIDYAGDGDYVGDLFWVGDLDSDGKLDLFMDFWNYEKGGYSSGLFLSSEAKKGKLVKMFHFYGNAGC